MAPAAGQKAACVPDRFRRTGTACPRYCGSCCMLYASKAGRELSQRQTAGGDRRDRTGIIQAEIAGYNPFQRGLFVAESAVRGPR